MNKCAAVMVVFACLALGCEESDGVSEPTLFDDEISVINGEVPPGELLPLQDVEVLLDVVKEDGNRLVVMRGTRLAGTRVGIHVHKFGGHTCVESGEITDFVEGLADATYPAGSCYYMPSNTPMAAANLGEEDAVLIDTFVLPPGEDMITILEPGWDF